MNRGSVLLLLMIAAPARPVHAQIRASERGRTSQVVDGTTITIDYARPRVRGRPQIFGRAVEWGEVWTPGANMATTLEADHDIVLDGHQVPKGKYSVWMVVDSGPRWTMVLDTLWEQYHEDRPPARGGQIRWPITPVAAPATEVLSWSFPEITATGGTMRMAWADRTVSLPFTVPPTHPVTTARKEAEPLVGRYRVHWLKADGTPETWHADQTVAVTYENGALLARWAPKLWGPDDRTYLIRLASNWLTPGFIDHRGQVVDVFTEWVLEFDVAGSRARGFEVRGQRDRLAATAVRMP